MMVTKYYRVENERLQHGPHCKPVVNQMLRNI